MNSRRVRITVAALSCAVLAACSFGNPPPDQSGAPPNLPTPTASGPSTSADSTSATIEVLATKLDAPWGITFLRDGTGLVTERRTGKILSVGEPAKTNGLTVSTLTTVHGLSTSGDGGLLGIAASPHYGTDKTLYIYYSTSTDNRIAALRIGDVATPRVIVKGIPHARTANGGALMFGPDGALYAGTGDAGNAKSASDPKSLAGKILRMTTTGKPVKGASSLVYASGFHDVGGLTWDREGHLFVMDPSGTKDRLQRVIGDKSAVGSDGSPAVTAMTWPMNQSACAGLAVIGSVLATSCLSGKRVWIVSLTQGGGTFGAPTALLKDVYGRLRAAVAAPDGSLWITTSNTDGHGQPKPGDDQIIRIVLATEGAGRS